MNRQRASASRDCVVRLAAIVTFLTSTTAAADNLLVNSGFSQSHPDGEFPGWTLELAKDRHSECSVVAGRGSKSRALRICNDEFGGSFIR
jgi:hypothetical protein